MSIAEPPPAVAPPPPPARPRADTPGDRAFRILCQLAGLTVLAIAGLLVLVLVIQAWPALVKAGQLKLFTSTDWNPDKGSFGALAFVYGTVATSAIAMLVATPLGVGSAAFLSEIAPRPVRTTCAFLLELLAAVPSVVYGFWAKLFLAPLVLVVLKAMNAPGLREGDGGQGILAAGLVLAVMVLPYITAVSYDVCQAVPRSQRQGALALGATRWQTIWRVVLPYARPGIVAGCFLALGRALGETMAVTMVIGNAEYLSFSPAATGDTIPSVIAKSLHETTGGDRRASLMALALLLLGITLVMNVTARLLVAWGSRPRGPKGGAGPARVGDDLPPPPPADPRQQGRARSRALWADRLMTGVLAGCQLLTVVPLFLILGFIGYRGASEVDWRFFTELPPPRGNGLGNAVLGSLMLVGMAAAFAVPVGILTAVYLSENSRTWLGRPVRFVADLLGGVPSIVVGVFGYAMLVYPFWAPGQRWGFSAWAGAFALGVMMLPTVIRSAEEAMKLVPRGLREASYALGAGQRQTVLRVIVPAALPAILTGVLLAVGRVAGETAPLILTARGSNLWPRSPAESTASVPYFIYEYSKMLGQPEYERLGWAAAFVLLMAVLVLNTVTRLVAGRRVVDASRAD
ncbi:MAG: phosphate ABC transporter permease subunit PstC [Gemmataceae bacterium]